MADSIDGAITLREGTSFVTDLDLGTRGNPDLGTDVCILTHKETNGFGEDLEKPTSYLLSLRDLSSTLVTSDTTGKVGEKVKIGALTGTDDGDSSYYVLVSRDSDPTKTDSLFFSGTVDRGDSFEATGSFGSETYVHIYSSQGGSLLQTISYHTSCSSPLIIGDQYGTVTLEGVTMVGRDTRTVYDIGGTETGDAGVVYEITGGSDADDFVVDPQTGEVTFATAPDFETPTDSDGDNKYHVEVTAFHVDTGGDKILGADGEPTISAVKLLVVVVEDELDEVRVEENTTPVANVNLTVDCPKLVSRDVGVDICAMTRKETNGFGEDTSKPVAYELMLEALSTQTSTTQGGKLVVGAINTGNDSDKDGEYLIRVSRESDHTKTDQLFFSGTVKVGDSFTAAQTGTTSFAADTYIHILDEQTGTLIQTIKFHTSCSEPLVVGDDYGSVKLAGATLIGKDTTAAYEIGGTEISIEKLGEGDIVYSIAGGSDAAFLTVDPDTGEMSFIAPPDFENANDAGGDNVYDVIIRATAKSDPTCFTDRALQVRVEDVPEFGSLSGRYFCDTNDNEIEDSGDAGVANKLVTLFSSDGEVVIATAITDADGRYSFENLDAGTYSVMFEGSFAEGKRFVTPDVGSDDAIDSDVLDTVNGTTAPVLVIAGEETTDVDAGVAYQSYRFDKDIGNIVTYLDCDGTSGEEITKVKLEFDFDLTSVGASQILEALALNGFGDCDLLGLTIKAGNNKGGFGLGEGRFFDMNPTDDLLTGSSEKADYEFFIEDVFLFA